MPNKYFQVIIPSEIQAREFDAKLLLACFLAETGVPVYVGARHEIHANIHQFPPALYVAKDFRKPSDKIIGIMDQLGHTIVAWDEEGLLTYSPDVYYGRRVSKNSISRMAQFYAWGESNKALIENAPGFPGVPVHVTGNPRIDLLRPELRDFHRPAVEQLRARFGPFILINTNFGYVNHVVPSQIIQPGDPDPKTGLQMVPELHNVMRHRGDMLKVILELLPRIASRFPEHTIILRPHPAENHRLWKDAAKSIGNIHVIHEGPVLPWLLAAGILIQNGCTTGMESFLLDRPAIMYEPKHVQPGLPMLSDPLSYRIDNEDALFELVSNCLETGKLLAQTPAMWDGLNKSLAGTTGPLASERIAGHMGDLLKTIEDQKAGHLTRRASGQFQSRKRRLKKSFTALWPGHKTSRQHNQHRYPGLKLDEVKDKINRLSNTLSRFEGVGVEPVSGQIFKIEKPV